MIEKSTTILI